MQSKCAHMNFNILDDHAAGTEARFADVNFSKLETELKDYVIKQEVCACAKKDKRFRKIRSLLLLSIHMSSFSFYINLVIFVLFPF